MPPAEDIPVVCTLDSDTMAGRLRRIQALTDTSLLSHEVQGGRLRLAYRLEAAEQLRAIVELERGCCAFLDFEVQEWARFVGLTITAPAHAEEAGAWLFSQFLPGAAARASSSACGCASKGGCA